MGPDIAAIAYAVISIAIAALLMPREAFCGLRLRVLAVWLASLPMLVFVSDPLLALIAMFMALIASAPLLPMKRTAYFILLIPCFPLYLSAELPFPGLNHLIVLDYYKAAVLALLFPLILIPRPENAPRTAWSLPDFCIIAFIIYTLVPVAANFGLTGAMRFLLDQCILIAAPYFAFSRIAAKTEDVHEWLRAFLGASVILAAIAFVATFKQWDFYRIKEPPSIFAVPDLRSGFVRIQATLNTHSLGFHLAAAFIFLAFLRQGLASGLIRRLAFGVVLLGGVYFTDSRGALAGLAIAASVYTLLSIRNAALRWVLIAAGAVAVLVTASVLIFSNPSEFDPYGSFSYRQQLLDASLRFMGDHLIFGDFRFLESGRFDHLMQGQGIIDITNLYLQIGLSYGLVGLFLFFTPFIVTVIRLAFTGMPQPDRTRADGDRLRRLSALLCAVLTGWLAYAATTSNVGLSQHLGLFFLGVGHALVQQHARRRAARAAALKNGLSVKREQAELAGRI